MNRIHDMVAYTLRCLGIGGYLVDYSHLERYYPMMQQWLEYVDTHSVNGLLKKWPNTEYRNWYLGDWATPEGVGNPNHIDERSVDLVSNCYISVCLDQMKNIAEVVEKQKR